MFGPKLTTVFGSRWRTLWFCASVLLFAWMTIPSDDPDDLSDEQRQQIERAMENLKAVSGEQ